ncbi:hypothetical protein EZS27_040498, partial [termite gut metagenome]
WLRFLTVLLLRVFNRCSKASISSGFSFIYLILRQIYGIYATLPNKCDIILFLLLIIKICIIITKNVRTAILFNKLSCQYFIFIDICRSHTSLEFLIFKSISKPNTSTILFNVLIDGLAFPASISPIVRKLTPEKSAKSC